MLTLLSPSKTLDFEQKTTGDYSIPQFAQDSFLLMQSLKKLSQKDIAKLMDLSENLSALNHQRFADFAYEFNTKNSLQAIKAFKGDVYDGLDAANYSASDVKYANKHLRILSGLYGLLRPLDLIQPYRLEMGTKLNNPCGKNLYEFWQEKLTANINKEEHGTIVNLASGEYWKALNAKKLQAKVITPVFKENKNGKYSVVMLFAKSARGLMASYIIKNRIEDASRIKDFAEDGYKYNAGLSKGEEWVFAR